MKNKNSIYMILLILCSFFSLKAQTNTQVISYKIAFKTGTTNCYDVSFKANQAINATTNTKDKVSSAQVTIVAPAGTSTLITSLTASSGISFNPTSNFGNYEVNPFPGNASLEYITFGIKAFNPTSAANTDYVLFSFCLNACANLRLIDGLSPDSPYLGAYTGVTDTKPVSLDPYNSMSFNTGSPIILYEAYQGNNSGKVTCPISPVATNDLVSTPQGKPVSGNVLTNDDDPQNSPLTVSTTPVSSPSKGTVVLNPDGTFTYTPNPTATGQDGFCYQVSNIAGLKDTACVVVNIIPNQTLGNDKPIANDDNTQTEVNTPVTINAKANDTDPDGNTTLGTPLKLSNPLHGSVSQNPDGTFVYTPTTGFVGSDVFTYQICDGGIPIKCDTASVTINILPASPAGNKPPVAVDDAVLTSINTPVSGTVASNDSDPDNTVGQLTYAKVTSPTHGTVVQNPDGTYSYTPTTGYTGNDSYTYKVCDPLGKCDTATVSIAILPAAPQVPVATNDIVDTPVGKPVTGNVLTNDKDPNGGVLTVSTTPVTPPSKGTVVLNPDGTFTYTPNPTATGQDGFCYQVTNTAGFKDTACVVVNIIPNQTLGNDKPIANDDNTQTEVNTPVTINAKANDTDPDGNATLGTPLKLTNPLHGSVSQNSDGTFVYTPTAGFVGSDVFTYQICDGGIPIKCDTASVTINILPASPVGNKPPVAVDDAVLTSINTPVSGTVASNDSDPDNIAGQLTYAKVTSPTHGTVVQNGDGTYSYTPTTGYTGNDSYTYKVCDPSGKCDTATVSIAILPAALLAPIGTNDIITTTEGKPVTGNVLTNDKDPNGGVLTVSTTPVTPPSKGTVVLNPDGTFTYTPNPTASGQDGFCYQVTNTAGLKDTACVVVNIIPNQTLGNDKPIANDDNTQTEVNTPVTINAKANDTDPDGNATLGTPSKLTNPLHGTVTQNPDGTFVYTPTTGFVGSDVFTYQICDGGSPIKCDTATVTVNVLPASPAGNKPPVAVDDAVLTNINTPVSGTVASNDSDPDNTAGQLTYAKVTSPTHGTVVQNGDGTYSYTPTTGYTGNDSYTYKVCDPSGKCDTATVSIAILPAAPTPSLTIAKAVQSATLNPNQNFNYTLTVGNNGSVSTSGLITVRDTLQANLAFIVGTSSGWTCSAVGQVVSCTSSNVIAVGSTNAITLTVTAIQAGTYLNKAGVYGGSDPVAINAATAKVSNSVTTTVIVPCVSITPKAFLLGALFNTSSALMRDDLRSKGLIPLSQPYGYIEYSDVAYSGTETTTSAVLAVSGANAIVDWVVVELRDATNPATISYRQAALIQRDGDIVQVDGVSPLSFCNLPGSQYYVAVRHRNHLGVMTATAITLGSNTVVDFSLSSTATWKSPNVSITTLYPQAPNINGVYAMWSGNASIDKSVKAQGSNNDQSAIVQAVWNDPSNTSYSNIYSVNNYLKSDINMNGVTKMQGTFNDVDYLYNVIWFHPENTSVSNIFSFYQQLP